MPYKHFTLEERKYLQKLLEEGLSGNKIAAALGRSPSSISRELKRNSSKNPKKPTNRANYHHWRAHSLAMMRRRDHRRTALPPESFKRDYVCRGLSLFWSPEQIANRLREDFPG
ncbi:MAG: helix-turn-helix domain-containing protein, partial [Oscillospiraceae bacterium]|nr:helix-turn-helix domain-containing protein [Clostridiales bacterium]MDY2717900.1 helix-turn-helix domain-containing protein [Oscillospiraceae bacterium]